MSMTVQDLVDAVISRIDQNNRKSVTLDKDILPAINRAYGQTTSSIALKSEEFLLTTRIYDTILTDDEGYQYVVIPEDALNQRIMSVEYAWPNQVSENTHWTKGQIINQQEACKYREFLTSDYTDRLNWYVMGRKLFIVANSPLAKLKIHYVQRPLPLVIQQGRVYAWDATQRLLIVDVIGDNISLQTSDPGNYINIIDNQTGQVKATSQILSTDGTTKLYLRENSLRTAFRGLPVTQVLPADLEEDDYICIATGTCVLPFDEPVFSAILEIAVAEIDSKLGEGDKEITRRTLNAFEKKVDDLRVNVPNRKRVNATGPWTKRNNTGRRLF